MKKKFVLILLLGLFSLTGESQNINEDIIFIDSIVNYTDSISHCSLKASGPILKVTLWRLKQVGSVNSCVDGNDEVYRERVLLSYKFKNGDIDSIKLYYKYKGELLFYSQGLPNDTMKNNYLNVYFENDLVILVKEGSRKVDTIFTKEQIEKILNIKY